MWPGAAIVGKSPSRSLSITILKMTYSICRFHQCLSTCKNIKGIDQLQILAICYFGTLWACSGMCDNTQTLAICYFTALCACLDIPDHTPKNNIINLQLPLTSDWMQIIIKITRFFPEILSIYFVTLWASLSMRGKTQIKWLN